MRIFVIPSGYVSPINPQHNIFVHEQCKALLDRGHKVIVLDANIRSPRSWNIKYCKEISQRYEDDIKVYSYWTRALPLVKFPRISIGLYEKRLRILWNYAVQKEGLPDIIYSHFTFPSGYVATKISKELNIPNVTIEHGGIFFRNKLKSYLTNSASFTVKNSSKFLCVSKSQLEAICNHVKTNVDIITIPNMISNIFTYYPVVDTDVFVFFSAGNLKSIKRFDLLINAFAKAFNKNENIVLRIAGEGEEKINLQNLISSLKLDDKIVLLGRLSREEILDELKKCNVFTLASDHESFGIVYREATACGRPIVSTRNGGISEGWSDDFGITVPCDNLTELSNALSYMYKNYSKFSPKKISAITMDFCSEKTVIDQIENILLNAVGENNVK